ncbi:Aste57867_9684 [Aphanomyces stellatus]|uniref:Aste57867_9684 protein n=1 Tax=Aphanomyces stellatus TaxID=120398 RepID=A0A485KNJ8_9STRA|nr:hypothetical protein As57867_009646 [Aphanomyces stellatus]VFT86563.1 Aste57867_9684 [Aphanomyces stellatus]
MIFNLKETRCLWPCTGCLATPRTLSACPLCYEYFRDLVLVDAPCSLHFCRACIQRWFRKQPRCPLDRHPCSSYTDPMPELVAALGQVDFVCDNCLWEGKWVDHQTCPLLKCLWCPWKSYDDGKLAMVPEKLGKIKRGIHRRQCPGRENAAKIGRWVNGDNGIGFGMTLDELLGAIFGSEEPPNEHFSCFVLVVTLTCRLSLSKLLHVFPYLPTDVPYVDESYCSFLFEKDAGLRAVSLRFLETEKDPKAMPRILAFFTQLFQALLSEKREAVVLQPSCTILMVHLKRHYHDVPGLLQTFVEFVDPRNQPQNGLNHGQTPGADTNN